MPPGGFSFANSTRVEAAVDQHVPQSQCRMLPEATSDGFDVTAVFLLRTQWVTEQERKRKKTEKNLKRKKKRQKKCSENPTGLRSNVAQALPSGVREGAAIRSAGQEKAC